MGWRPSFLGATAWNNGGTERSHPGVYGAARGTSRVAIQAASVSGTDPVGRAVNFVQVKFSNNVTLKIECLGRVEPFAPMPADGESRRMLGMR
jgi:hypothetical protein